MKKNVKIDYAVIDKSELTIDVYSNTECKENEFNPSNPINGYVFDDQKSLEKEVESLKEKGVAF